MMNDLLQELSDKNIKISCEEGKLKYSGPENYITTELLKKLKDNKEELINILSSFGNSNKLEMTEELETKFDNFGQFYSYLQNNGYKFSIKNAKLSCEFPAGGNSQFIEKTIEKHHRHLYQITWPMPNANLTPIQPEGEGDPFFIVHGEEATAFFKDIFGKELPLFDYFHQSCDGTKMKYKRVEEVAEHYLQQLLSVKSEGSFLLAGYSFGGLVAYDIAQRLIQMGKKVELLVIIDTTVPKFDGFYYKFHFYSVFRRLELSVIKPFREWIKALYFRTICNIYFLKGKALPTQLRPFYIVDNYERYFDHYSPKPYNGKLHLITSQNNYMSRDPYLGWRKYIKEEITLIKMTGSHREIMQKPETVRLMAEKIKEIVLNTLK